MIQIGTLVLSPDDGCVGVVLEQSKQYLHAYRIQWADGVCEWYWAEMFEIIA
jgi:hypothetical protein